VRVGVSICRGAATGGVTGTLGTAGVKLGTLRSSSAIIAPTSARIGCRADADLTAVGAIWGDGTRNTGIALFITVPF
jgi:hypothetical protein